MGNRNLQSKERKAIEKPEFDAYPTVHVEDGLQPQQQGQTAKTDSPGRIAFAGVFLGGAMTAVISAVHRL